MKTFHLAANQTSFPSPRRLLSAAALVLCAASLAACSKDEAPKESKPGQALASVNGEEITVLQLNEELQRLGVSGQQQQAAGKQVLQALVDRELLESEAAKEKLDRDPKVMQAIERARSLIIAQAYMQKRLGEPVRPSPAEVEDYFNKNPQFFANRKQFAMNELILAANDLTPEVRAAADKAKSLEEVAVFLDARNIKYGRAQVTRSTADLNPQLSSKLLSMDKGQLFAVKEGDRAMLISIAEVRDAPVTLAIAGPQIGQYLMNKKQKEAAAAEIQRLRGTAKIAYLNKDYAPNPNAPATAPAAVPAAGAADPAATAVAGADAAGVAPAAQNSVAPAADTGAPADKAALDRGVAGLK
ncbi:EpsD family peptidyl-prolyl cis-trans isomerase [Massilia sp. IC2-476]|uniref:EpsD family peptidyl-prolyl cis-trans isomerase n=1 Tax=Massilia sp. IC2-476 TaxID=2887199 RepID=UPI001D1283D3|nr:EpsD family peptidyl-prolyl cis-trans isomerase [Massilia sp. IC2-476]MCC2972036.1 EpsD family peptidyl-prolyl cis-trans isomerase [Massilia sp. IC2-476]